MLDELATRLAKALVDVPGASSSIVHGDYRLDNCLMDRHDPGRIAAVSPPYSTGNSRRSATR